MCKPRLLIKQEGGGGEGKSLEEGRGKGPSWFNKGINQPPIPFLSFPLTISSFAALAWLWGFSRRRGRKGCEMRQGEEDLASHSLDGGAGGEQCFQPFSSAFSPFLFSISFGYNCLLFSFPLLRPREDPGARRKEGERDWGRGGGKEERARQFSTFLLFFPSSPFPCSFLLFFRSHAQRLILYSGFLLLLLLLLLPLFCHPLLASRTFLLFRRPWLHLRRRGEEAEIKREVFKRPKVRRGKRPSARVPCVVAA